jgi:hypothetical protein
MVVAFGVKMRYAGDIVYGIEQSIASSGLLSRMRYGSNGWRGIFGDRSRTSTDIQPLDSGGMTVLVQWTCLP